MKLLYFMDKAPKDKVEMTLKVIGHQWYWSYEYPDAGNLAFDSNLIPDEEIDVSKGQIRLLEVDNRVAIPVDTTIRVIIYVSAGDGLFGVDSDQEAVDLASTITKASNLELAGITGGEAVNDILGAKRTIEAAGIPVYSVTINGEADYKQVGMMEDVTEVLAGSYALMDHSRRELFPEFKCAGRIMSTVTSRPEAGYMITDAGQKSIGAATGFPSIDNLPESSVKGLSAEHGSIYFSQSKHCNPQLGDKVWCTPHDIATCVNLHDYMFIVSHGTHEAIWDVPARGRYR